MLAAKPVTIEIVASGAGPAEISLLTAGLTEAEYVGDPGGFAFRVTQEGDGPDNADAPTIMTVNNNIKLSNLRAEHKVYSRSNGHLPSAAPAPPAAGLVKHLLSASNGSLPNNQVPGMGLPPKNSNNKNFFLSRKNNDTTSMSFLQSLDAKLQRLHDYARRGGRHRRAAEVRDAREPGAAEAKEVKHIVQHPKPFMTVVRQGTFLKPPPELAALLGLTSSLASSADSSLNASHQHAAASLNSSMLYSFASRPRVLMQAHRQHCDAAAAPTAMPPLARVRRAAPLASQPAPPAPQDDADDGQLYSNLMHDRRVIRGNTFAHQPLPAGPQPEWDPHFAYARLLSQDAQDSTAAALRQAEARRRAQARRKALQQHQLARGARGRAGTPPPVAGRQHLDVQTDRYLEEIFDKPLESEVCCQTDLFVERPATPQFVPAAVGKDAETQIEPGELFDFDEEVTPVLEVLVGRTVEQAMVEVLEEEETAATQRQRARLEEVRLQQHEEQARLRDQELTLRLEQGRRVAELAAARRAQHELEERATAAALSADYLEQLLPNVLESLRHVSEPVQKDVGEKFMPWLVTEVKGEMHKMMTSREVISDIVREVLEARAELKRATVDSPGRHGDDRPSPAPSAPAAPALGRSVVGEAGDAADDAGRAAPL